MIDDETDRAIGMQRMEEASKKVDRVNQARLHGDAADAKAAIEDAGPMAALGDTLKTVREQLAMIRGDELQAVSDAKLTEGQKFLRLERAAAQRRKVMQAFNAAYDQAVSAPPRKP